MIFKRKKTQENDEAMAAAGELSTAGKNSSSDEADTAFTGIEIEAADNSKSAPVDRVEKGPFDLSEVTAIRPYIDMGSLKIAPREGLNVRLDVDEKTKKIVAVSLDYEGSTLQLQAFSAPKSSGIWHEVRGQILDSLAAQGADITQQEGLFGPELLLRSAPDAQQQAAVRFFGVDGPRWLLRGVLVGEAALNPEKAQGIESVFREVVVVRGEQPLPPSELLPLKVPGQADS